MLQPLLLPENDVRVDKVAQRSVHGLHARLSCFDSKAGCYHHFFSLARTANKDKVWNESPPSILKPIAGGVKSAQSGYKNGVIEPVGSMASYSSGMSPSSYVMLFSRSS